MGLLFPIWFQWHQVNERPTVMAHSLICSLQCCLLITGDRSRNDKWYVLWNHSLPVAGIVQMVTWEGLAWGLYHGQSPDASFLL